MAVIKKVTLQKSRAMGPSTNSVYSHEGGGFPMKETPQKSRPTATKSRPPKSPSRVK